MATSTIKIFKFSCLGNLGKKIFERENCVSHTLIIRKCSLNYDSWNVIYEFHRNILNIFPCEQQHLMQIIYFACVYIRNRKKNISVGYTNMYQKKSLLRLSKKTKFSYENLLPGRRKMLKVLFISHPILNQICCSLSSFSSKSHQNSVITIRIRASYLL